MSSREERMDEHKYRLTHQDEADYPLLSEYPVKENEDKTDSMIRFLCTVEKLKTIDRTGWILEDRDIKKPESVAGHMYRMAIMAMILDDSDDEEENSQVAKNESDHSNGETKKKLNKSKVIKMSLIHDMAECIVGDITPFDGVTEEEKHSRELKAIEYLTQLLPKKASTNFLDLYHEYEARQSPEAKVVKELDRFDVMLQAFQYEVSECTKNNHSVKFDEFFDSAMKHVHYPQLKKMVDKIVSQRHVFWENQEKNTESITNGDAVIN